MFKIFLLLFTTAFAKLTKPSYDYIIFEAFNTVDDPSYEYKKTLPTPNAWVLSLNRDVETLKLRVASSDEVREVFGKQDNIPNHRQPEMGKDSPQQKSTASPRAQKTIKVDEKALLAEIMRVINKFALTTHNEPDAYLGDEADNTTAPIKLYFKGPHTSLVVRAEGKQWHYIISPSLFPDWFYGGHNVKRDSHGPFVDVPKDVAVQFYATLLHLLTMFLTLPV